MWFLGKHEAKEKTTYTSLVNWFTYNIQRNPALKLTIDFAALIRCGLLAVIYYQQRNSKQYETKPVYI